MPYHSFLQPLLNATSLKGDHIVTIIISVSKKVKIISDTPSGICLPFGCYESLAVTLELYLTYTDEEKSVDVCWSL